VSLTAPDDGSPSPASDSNVWVVNVTDTVNNPPTCGGSVSPQNGHPPLTVTVDASDCVDPDGNALAFQWTVTTASGGYTTYQTATAEHVINESGHHEIALVATDDGVPPMQSSTQRFEVVIAGEEMAPIVATCGCHDTASGVA
jgi:hypothetical protein